MALEFEWDNKKAAENLRRHRIDFNQAADVFSDPYAFDSFDDAHYGEDRFVRVGISGGKVLTVVYTDRDDRIRIISARKATTNEQEDYDRRQARS